MQQRSISAIGVVLVGLVPALLGGWVFSIVFTLIAAIAYREAIAITAPGPSRIHDLGLLIVIAAGLLATANDHDRLLLLLVILAVAIPLVGTMVLGESHSTSQWTSTTATTLYLMFPAWAAISLRQSETFPARTWLQDLASWFPGVSYLTGGGLAWFLLALLVTWLSDTFAYLVGKSIGRRKLIPRVSPNKTIAGAIGGLVAAAITAVICDWVFGMEIGLGIAVIIGIALGVLGQLGDLCESMLKRAKGIKDSGTLIPGHGGMLDRIDALVIILVAAWLIAPLVN